MNIFAKTIATEMKILFRYKNSVFIGMVMQIFWGWLNIMIFSKFILQSNQSHFSLSYLCSYIWLMQSFIGITALWIKDDRILESIKYGEIAYELLRPISLFLNWGTKIIAKRLSILLIQGIPVIIYSYFFAQTQYSLQEPFSAFCFLYFLLSLVFALIVTSSLIIFINVISAMILSGDGIIYLFGIVGGLFVGSLIPLPMLPEWFQSLNMMLPFSGIADIPFKIYLGIINNGEIFLYMLRQLLWVFIISAINFYLFKNLYKTLVVQGG